MGSIIQKLLVDRLATGDCNIVSAASGVVPVVFEFLLSPFCGVHSNAPDIISVSHPAFNRNKNFAHIFVV